MRNVSEKFAAAMRTAPYAVKLTLDGTDTIQGGPMLDGAIQGMTYAVGSGDATSVVTVGSTVSTSVTLELNRSLVTVPLKGRNAVISLGIELNDGMEWLDMGGDIVADVQESDDIITLTCRSALAVSFETTFKQIAGIDFSSPVSAMALASGICTRHGVAVDLSGLQDISLSDFDPDGCTDREIIGWLAALYGKFAIIDRDGVLRFRWFETSGHTISADDYYDGAVEKHPEPIKIAWMQCYAEALEETLKAGDTTGECGIACSCPWMTQERLEEIWATLDGFAYTPVESISVFGDPRIDLGDTITLEVLDGSTCAVPVMYVSHDWDGGVLTDIAAQSQTSGDVTEGAIQRENKRTRARIIKKQNAIEMKVEATADKVTALELSAEEITASVEEVKKTSDEALAAAQQNANDLNDYANQVNGSLTDLQNQIDGAIETWFYSYVPTASNAPASSWTTTEDKNKHLGDLFYIIDNDEKGGQVYRWALVNGVYGWVLVEDTEVAKALETASRAQDTADGKRRVFVAQPVPPYDVGDLWTNGTDLYRCNNARQTGSYTASDWGLATEYITETATKALIKIVQDSITLRVESTEKGLESAQSELAQLKLTAGQVSVVAQKSEVIGTTHSFSFDDNGNLILTYTGERPKYSLNADGDLILEYDGDVPPDVWMDEEGIVWTTEESAMIKQTVGTLTSVIDGAGEWKSEFEQAGKVVSSIRFDLATRKFVFDGDVIVGDDLRDDITKITNDTLETTSITAKYLKLAGSININDNFIVDELGNVQLNGNITWGVGASPTQAVYAESALTKPPDGTKWASFPASGTGWHQSNFESDYYASYTYDGGESWTDAILVRGIKGATGDTGATGAAGKDGADGKSIGTIVNYYLATASASGVTAATSGWTTSVQSVTSAKKYLWNYEIIKYSDGMIASTSTPCIIGAYGDTGAKGDTGATGAIGAAGKDGSDGVGIKSITEYYQVSTSNSTAPTSWATTPPTLTATNKYLWNYEVIAYTDGTFKNTSKRVIGVYGDKGATGDTGATGAAGKDGTNGKDGASVRVAYLYCRKNTSTAPSTPSYTGGTLPDGWSVAPAGVTAYYKYEFVSQCIVTDGVYGSWSTPVLWAKYGEDGTNGTDASVTAQNVFNALTGNGTMYGCFYGSNSKLYINADFIQSGKILADVLDVDVLNSLKIKAGSVDAEDITGTTITGKVLSGVTGEFSGTVTATYLKAVSGGNLAGWTIDDNSMRIGTLGASGSMWLCNTGTSTSASIGTGSGNGWCIAVGSQFGVKKDGVLYASNADLSGKITASSGNIGGFTIGTESMKSTKSGYGLGLFPGGTLIGSYTFFLVIYSNGGAQPVGGLTASGWKTI